MKTKRNNPFLSFLRHFFATPALVISFFGVAEAAPITWDTVAADSAVTGGAGTWNTALTNWTTDAGATNVAWVNGNDVAIFGGSGGAVSLGAAITANGITFDGAGYSVTANTLTLAGTTPTITANADATITSQISGAAGLVKAGTGTLTLVTGANNYSGATVINSNSGTLRLGDGTTQPTINSTYAIGSDSTLKIQYNGSGSAAPTWSKYTGAGTLQLASGKNFDYGWGEVGLTAGFTGTLRIDGGRVSTAATPVLGGTTKVIVNAGGHFGVWNNGTTIGAGVSFEIAGTGYGETTYEEAIRMANGGATSTINGPVLITANASIASGGTGVINGVISGAIGANLNIGALTGTSQAGIIELGGANTFAGNTTMTMGTLRLNNQLALQNSTLSGNIGAVTFNSAAGTAFTLGGLQGARNLSLQNTAAAGIALSVGNNNASTSYDGVLTGSGSLVKVGTGTLTLTGSNVNTGGTTVSDGDVEIAGAGKIGSGLVTIDGSKTLNFNSTAAQTWGAGLSGAGTLAKNGSGTLTLDGVSASFTGLVDVNASALRIGNYLELGSGAAIDMADGTSLVPGNLSDTNPAGTLVYVNRFITDGTVTIDASSSTFSFSSTPTIGSPVTIPLVIYDSPSIGGDGFSALSLSLPRNLQGLLLNTAGQLDLKITGFNATTWVGNVNSVWETVASNWKLNAVATAYQNGDIVLFNDSATGAGAVGITLDTTVTPNSIEFANATRAYTISGTGAIAGSGAIKKAGAAAVTLSTNNTFTSAVSIDAGMLKLGHVNALGAIGISSGTTVASGAVLDLNGINLSAETLTINGTGISSGGVLINSSVTAVTTAAPIALHSDSSIGGIGNMTLSGVISGSVDLTKAGAGTVTLTGVNTFSGTTFASGGTLLLGVGGNLANSSGITINNGGTVRFGGSANSDSIGSGNKPITVSSGGVLSVVSANAMGYNNQTNYADVTLNGGLFSLSAPQYINTLTLNGGTVSGSGAVQFWFAVPTAINATDDATISAPIALNNNFIATTSVATGKTLTISGVVQSSGSLFKTGLGTLKLTATNTYAGATEVNEGTLIVPSAQSSSAYHVADNASLAITGTPGSSFSVTRLAVGDGTVASLSIGNFGEQTAAANAPVKTSTILDFYGAVNLSVGGFFSTAGTYPLFSYSAGGYYSGSFDAVTLTLPPNVSGMLQDNPDNKTMDLVVSAVNTLVWKGSVVGGLWDVNNTANWFTNPSALDGKYKETMVVRLDDSATGTTSVVLNSLITPSVVNVNNPTKNYTLSGTGGIGGDTSMIKTGAGTLTLTTANTYSGSTVVGAGTLALGDGTANGSVTSGIFNNASLVLNNGATAQTYAGLISGTGTLTKVGSGIFTLGGANTYTGTTTVSGGTLRVTGSLGASPVVDNANLEFNRVDAIQVNPTGVISGTGTVAYSGPAVATSLLGQFIIDDANTYSGGTTITNNRSAASTSTAFGSGPITVANGGQFYATTAGTVFANPITINGFGWPETAGQLGAIRLNGGAVLSGPISMGSDSRISCYGGAGTISNVISGGFNLHVMGNASSDSLTFSGASSNTYTGTTTLMGNAGQLILSKTGGAVAIPGDINMSATGTRAAVSTTANNQFAPGAVMRFTVGTGDNRFELKGTTQTLSGIDSTGFTGIGAFVQHSEVGAPPQIGSVSTLILNVTGNNPATSAPFNYGNAAGTAHLRAQGGTMALVKNGAGKQILTGAGMTYNGGTTLNAGTLEFAAANNAISGGMVLNGGTLNQTGTGYLVVTGLLNVAANSIVNVTNNGANNQLYFDTGITGASNLTINNTGTGTTGVCFRNGTPGLFSGDLTVNGGKIATQGNGFNFQNANVTLNGANWYMDNTQYATTAANEQVKSLSGDGNIYIGVQTLMVGTNNGTGSLSGSIIGTTGTLTKTGSGTQTLGGVNTYTGTTTISGGTVILTGSMTGGGATNITAGNLTLGAAGMIDATSSLTLASGSVFDVSATAGFTQTTGKTLTAGRTSGSGNDIVGNLTTGGAVNVAGTGTGPVGKLSVSGNLALTGSGTVKLDLSGNPASGNDLVAAGGSLTLTGATFIAPTFTGTPDTVNPYTLITYSGTDVVNRAANFTVSMPENSRYAASIVDTTTTPGSIKLQVTGSGKSLVWSGAAAALWLADAVIPNAPTQNWNAGADNFQNLDSVTFDDTNATGSVTLNSTVSPSSITVGTTNGGVIPYTISGSGSIAAGSLIKTGTATLTLSTANTFSGGTLIRQGQISSGNGSAMGIGGVVLNDASTGANNTALLASTAQTSNNNIVVTNNGSGTVTLGSVSGLTGLVIYNGSVNLGKAVTIIGSSDRTTYNGKISGNVGTLTIAGSAGHRVTIANPANDFVGDLAINTGMIYQSDSPTALPVSTSITNAGTYRLNSGGTHAVDTINGAGAIIIIAGGATTLSIGNGVSGGNSNISGVISDNTAALSLIKNGSGSLTLAGANTFTGTTRLNSGATFLTNSLALAGSTLVWDNLGGTLDLGSLTSVSLGGLQGAQNLPMLNASSALVNLTVGSNSATFATYTGVLGGASFTKTGTSALTLAGSSSNTYGGNFTVNTLGGTGGTAPYTSTSLYLGKTGGALAVPANTTVQYGTNTTGQANLRTLQNNQFGAGVVVNFGNAVNNWTRFDLVATNQTLAGANSGNLTTAGSGIFQNAGLDAVGAGPATLTFNGDSTQVTPAYPVGGYVFNGYIRDTDGGANALKQINIVKNGTGKQTIVGANVAYTGTTTVNAGIWSQVDTTNFVSPTSLAASGTLNLNRSVAGFASRSRIGGLISGAGTINISNTTSGIGGGWVTFNSVANGLSNFTGTINVNSGVLSMDNTAGAFSGNPILNVAVGGHFAIRNQDISIGNLTGAGDVGNYHNSTKTLTVGSGDYSGTFSGTLHGNNSTSGTDGTLECGIMALTKVGSGTMTLSAPLVSGIPTSTNTFAGNITVNGGKLIGAAVGPIFGAANNTRIITLNTGTTMEFQGPNAFGNHGGGNAPTIVINNAIMTNSDPALSNKVNNGLRNVTLANGTLTSTAGNGSSLIDGTNRPNEGYGCWGLNGTVTSSGTSLISSSASGMAGRVLLNSSGNDTTMNVTDGTLTVSAPLQGGDGDAGGLTKTGSGKLVLSAVNIYKGPTTVSAGTLQLNGSMIKSDGAAQTPSNITVASGATLMGTGTATGTLTANGIVAPGASIGILSVGATTFGLTGSLSAEINSTTLQADKLAVTGALSIDPAATLNVTDLGSGTPTSAKLVLITYSGAWDNGTFNGLPDDSPITINGNIYTINYNDTHSGVNAVTLRIGAGDSYDSWASSFSLTGADALKGADPDQDGVNNLLEFATNSDPTSVSSGPRVYPLMHVIGADKALTYTIAVRKNAVFAPAGTTQAATMDQVLYTVEASDGLDVWNVVPVTEVTGATATAIQTALGSKLTVPMIGADWQWHTFRTNDGAQVDPTDFIRVKVTSTP